MKFFAAATLAASLIHPTANYYPMCATEISGSTYGTTQLPCASAVDKRNSDHIITIHYADGTTRETSKFKATTQPLWQGASVVVGYYVRD